MKKWNKAMNIESQNVGRNSEIQTNNTKINFLTISIRFQSTSTIVYNTT